MYRILLVEDEIIIRDGLKYIIRKMNLDIEDIYEASNGKEAVEVCKKVLPHIIITDIKMPEMDGLEFINHVRKSRLNPKFIILSGYSEFAYAQKAISYGVVEYLLKPIKKNQLYNVLSKLILQYEKEKSGSSEAVTSLHRVLLQNVLQGQYKPDEIPRVLKDGGIVFTESSFFILTAYMDPSEDFSAADGMEYLIRNCWDNFFKYDFYIRTKYMYNVFLFNVDKGALDKFDSFVKAIKSTLQSLFEEKRVVMQIGVSETGGQPETLPELLRQAEAALDYKALSRAPEVYVYSRLKRPKTGGALPVMYFEAIGSAISKADKNSITPAVHRLFEYLLRIDNVSPDTVIHAIKSLDNYLLSSDESLFAPFAELNETENSIEFLYRTSATIRDFISRINDRLFLLCDQVPSSNSLKTYSPIGYAINYIRQNYQKDLNLVMISNIVSMNPNYFSTLFKKKTGLSFVNYLQTVRTEKSKVLLMEPGAKIYEIAGKVGYKDEKYYCKVFKAITGLSPNEYREHHAGAVK